MKGIVRAINDCQKDVRKIFHALSGGAFPGDDDPFLIRLDQVALFAEDKPYARYHYQGKVMKTLPGVMPHREATVSQLKIEAMHQRITEGADWRDTRLFRDYYTQQLATKGRVKGALSLDALEAVYRDVYDGLYRSIRDFGFDWHPEAEMWVHVLDDGAFCWTSGGNHRLGVALALGLTEIPVRIRFRTRTWQTHRLSLAHALRRGEMTRDEIPDHPDLRGIRYGKDPVAAPQPGGRHLTDRSRLPSPEFHRRG
ncbi:MAG: hypothetical protein R6V26_06560 [Roseovarius sp.]